MKKKLNIIAEIGSVHDGSFGNAKNLVILAKNCGATHVKFQLHIPESESLKDAPAPSYFTNEKRYNYFKRTAFTISQWKELLDFSLKNKVEFVISPFSKKALSIINSIGCKNIKIPSGEVTNRLLLESISKTNKNLFLSTGMNNWKEIDQAVEILKKNNLTIMQCSSLYPCPSEKIGLNIIKEMKRKYNLPVGLSDHSNGMAAGVGAIALGAETIEKHITFSNAMYGSDACNAMEPKEFKIFSKELKNIWKIINNPVNKDDTSDYLLTKKVFEKSLVLKKNISKGSIISIAYIDSKKPGDGISVMKYKEVLGKKVKSNLKKNHKLKKSDLC